MTATMTLIYAGHVAEAIKSGDTVQIKQMIARKRLALAEALRLREECKDCAPDFVDEEATRAKRLQREIQQLEAAL